MVDTRHVQTVLANGTKRRIGDCRLKFHIFVATAMRPDMVLYSESEHIVYCIVLTIPFEDAVEEAFERKKEAKVCGTGSGSEGIRLASTHKTSGDRC